MSAPKKPRPAVDDEVKAKFRAALDANGETCRVWDRGVHPRVGEET